MNKIAFGIILTILIIIGVIYKFFDRILLFGLFICISELLYNGGTESYTLIGCSIIIISMIIMYYTKLSTILLILSIVVISDIFQEFSGKFFGKNKIGWISPNKTYEGYIGGYIGMLIFSVMSSMNANGPCNSKIFPLPTLQSNNSIKYCNYD